MIKNVGGFDRTIRFVLAVVIFALGVYYQSWWGLIGLIPLLTAITQRCPAFLPFGINTCKPKKSNQ